MQRTAWAERGWTALEGVRDALMQEATRLEVGIEHIAFVATFESWDQGSEIYIFYPTESDRRRCAKVGVDDLLRAFAVGWLKSNDYPFVEVPTLNFFFDSYENVKKNYGGNYFNRLR
jgi:hypothetical protein